MKDIFPDNVNIDNETKLNISNSAFEKIRKTKNKKLVKTFSSIAATFAVVFCMLWVIGFENVVSAAERIFYFIPGFGIEEQAEEPVLVLKKIASRKNKSISVTLVNAATENDEERMEGLLFNMHIKPLHGEIDPDEVYEFDFILKVGNKKYSLRKSYGANITENGISVQNIKIFTGNQKLCSGEKCVLTVSNKELGSVNIPFKLADAAAVDNVVIKDVGPTRILATKYSAKLQNEDYIVIDADISGASLEYGGYVVYRDADGNEILPETIIGNSSYFKESEITFGYKPYITEISVSVPGNVICHIRQIPIPEDGEKEETDIPFELPHGVVYITEVSRSGNTLKIKTETESQYNMDYVYINASRSEWYAGYVNYKGERYFAISENDNSRIIDPAYDTEDYISIKTNFIDYLLKETVELNFE